MLVPIVKKISLFLKLPTLTFLGLMLWGEFTGGSVTTLVQYIRANLDTTTQGVIVRIECLPNGKARGCNYLVWYGYEVDGEAYMSRTVNYLGGFDSVKEYPEGRRVTVHYDSSHPKYAVIQDTRLGFNIIFWWLFSFGLSFIVFMFAYPTKKEREKIKRRKKW